MKQSIMIAFAKAGGDWFLDHVLNTRSRILSSVILGSIIGYGAIGYGIGKYSSDEERLSENLRQIGKIQLHTDRKSGWKPKKRSLPEGLRMGKYEEYTLAKIEAERLIGQTIDQKGSPNIAVHQDAMDIVESARVKILTETIERLEIEQNRTVSSAKKYAAFGTLINLLVFPGMISKQSLRRKKIQEEMNLREFFEKLGITNEDIRWYFMKPLPYNPDHYRPGP